MKTRKSFWYRTSALSTVLYHSTISLRRVVRSTAWESFAGDIRRAPLSLLGSMLIAHPPWIVSQIIFDLSDSRSPLADPAVPARRRERGKSPETRPDVPKRKALMLTYRRW